MPAINRFLPGSPNPGITLPTTRYLSARPIPADLVAADEAKLGLQPSHLPLVWMLVLTQWACGSFALLALTAPVAQPLLASAGMAASSIGVMGSLLHLGKPRKAWRAFLGLRQSWLSREIVAFGLFIVSGALLTAQRLVANPASEPPHVLWVVTASSGLLGVFCSGMVYHKTGRAFWRGGLSLGKFFGTTARLGLATVWFVSELADVKISWVSATLIGISILQLARESALLRRCPDDADLTDEVPPSILGRSALLMRFRLGLLLRIHLAAAWIGGVVLPAVSILFSDPAPELAGLALLLCLTSEWVERLLFFRAVVPLKMPGGLVA